VVYTIAPSALRAGEIWIGTDDGLIQVTRDDGKTWHNVTPPDLTPWSKITHLEASHFDASTIYAAIDRHRLEDLKAHIFRTRDGGKTWQEISKGIPEGSYANAVREDPARKGLLFAGTETGVFVSFNDGDEWQPLQLNLPNASVRDLVIHGDDLVVATHGRSFWVLDDLTPLRQLSAQVASADVYLFRPQTALRVRAGSFEGTPLPPEEPQGENANNGALLDYYLKSAPSGPVTLEILDSAGKQVRRYASSDKPPAVDPKRLDIPMYWIHPAKPLSAEPGMHRFVWDLHYSSRAGAGNPRMAMFGFGGGPWAPPGQYTVKLTVDGRTYNQPLTVKMDPRIKTPLPALLKQFEVASRIGELQEQVSTASREAARLQRQLQSLRPKVEGQKKLSDALAALERRTGAIAGVAPSPTPGAEGEGPLPTPDRTGFRFLSGALSELERAVESADVAPSSDALTAFTRDQQAVRKALAQWNGIKSQELPRLNSLLREANLPAISF
jgi:hypothetical protein